jgi:hypothetical protein
MLLSATGNVLRVCLYYQEPNISIFELHKLTKRATPGKIGEFIIALRLYKTFSSRAPEIERINLK